LTAPLAAIDLGSNTVRLLVADAGAKVGIRPVWAEQVVVRLGEGVARRGTLAPAAMERALAAVGAYRDRARSLGVEQVIVIATAAVREAKNRDAFMDRLRAESHVVARVATGDEEARLALLGVAWGLGPGPAPFCLLDIGGGSTELVVARGAVALGAVSLRLGVVGLLERFLRGDPVDWAEYAACETYVAERFAAEAWPTIAPLRLQTLVGTAGTVTTLAALDLGLSAYDPGRVHGHRLTLEAVDALRAHLGALSVADRARLPCLEPGRADLIIPGIAIVLTALRGLNLRALRVADTGFREGILLDAVGWTPPAP